MNIRFTSTLTPEHENLIAPAFLKAVGSILDLLPIAYVIRIDTVDGQVHTYAGAGLHLSAHKQPLEGIPPVPEKFDS